MKFREDFSQPPWGVLVFMYIRISSDCMGRHITSRLGAGTEVTELSCHPSGDVVQRQHCMRSDYLLGRVCYFLNSIGAFSIIYSVDLVTMHPLVKVAPTTQIHTPFPPDVGQMC